MSAIEILQYIGIALAVLADLGVLFVAYSIGICWWITRFPEA